MTALTVRDTGPAESTVARAHRTPVPATEPGAAPRTPHRDDPRPAPADTDPAQESSPEPRTAAEARPGPEGVRTGGAERRPTRPAATIRHPTSRAPARASAPRARLVAAPPPAVVPRASGPAHAVPPSAEERITVLRAVDRSPGPVPTAPDLTTDVPALARGIALAVVEALSGRRPVAQLARWLSPRVYDRVRLRAELTVRVLGPATAARPPVVRRARTCALDPQTWEASVVVDDGTRVRAVALRLESRRGGWKTTALEVG